MAIPTYNIRELHLDLIPDNAKIAIIGKPGTGKSHLIKSIFYAKRNKYPVAKVFSGTEEFNNFYSKFIQPIYINNEFNAGDVERFIKRQKIAKEHISHPASIILLDDCTDDTKLLRHKSISSLAKNGRHYDMLWMLSLHYAVDATPQLRTCFDGIFIMRETNPKSLKSTHENYAGGVIPDFGIFCQIMREIANEHTALYLHNCTQSTKPEDSIFYYKAPERIPDFTFGCAEYVDHHKQRYNEKYGA
jgi:hypothetical protein